MGGDREDLGGLRVGTAQVAQAEPVERHERRLRAGEKSGQGQDDDDTEGGGDQHGKPGRDYRSRYNRTMELDGILTMVLILGAVWGGFAYFLYQSLSDS